MLMHCFFQHFQLLQIKICALVSDPYVKVSLWQNGKRLRKRKTTVHRKTVNPVFNEALFFDIPEESLSESQLIVQVIDYDR